MARRAENRGFLRAPIVRVLVPVRLLKDQTARLAQSRDARVVAVAEHVLTLQRLARLLREVARVVHGGQERQVKLQTRQVILLAVAGRRVHQAGARLGGDVVAPDDHRGDAVVHGVAVGDPLQVAALHDAQRLELDPPLFRRLRDQTLRHHQGLADEARRVAFFFLRRLALFRGVRLFRLHLHHGVVQLVVHRHRRVRGHRPRRGGPHGEAGGLEERLVLRGSGAPIDGAHGKRDVHRLADVSLRVLELRLGERGHAAGRPVHGLLPAVHVAVQEHLAEHLHLRGFVLRQQGEVRVLPISEDAVAFKLSPLRVDGFARERGGFFPQLDR